MPYPYYQGYQAYNPMYYQQQLQNMQQLNQPQQNMQSNPQIQNGGFVIVKDVTEAMNYPVAPGNSVTFKDEHKPYIYTKTLGFSQLDQPIFEVFKLVKEEKQTPNYDEPVEPMNELSDVEYVSIKEYEALKTQIDYLKTQIENTNSEIEFLKEYVELDKEVISA